MAHPDSPIRVLIVDDHPLMREGVAAVLAKQADMQLVGEAEDGQQAVQRYRDLRPDVTLMDLQMPVLDGLATIPLIREMDPHSRIVVLTMYKSDAQAVRALRAGAAGYLLKTQLRTELIDAIRVVHAGGRWIPDEVSREIATHAGEEALNEREIAVLRGIAAGFTNREIGDQLSVSEDTIKARVKTILSKLGARDRTHAVVIALKRGHVHL